MTNVSSDAIPRAVPRRYVAPVTGKDVHNTDRRLSTLLRAGLSGFRRNVVASVIGAAPVLLIYGVFRVAAANALGAGQAIGSFALDFLGLWLAGTAASPERRYPSPPKTCRS